MTDQEMLELAAKAAGLDYITPAEGYSGAYGLEIGTNPMRTQNWNPLHSDGDALRLAVDLGLRLNIDDGEHGFTTVGRVWSLSLCEHDEFADKRAATRRAIVMAAAEIGRDV